MKDWCLSPFISVRLPLSTLLYSFWWLGEGPELAAGKFVFVFTDPVAQLVCIQAPMLDNKKIYFPVCLL